MLQKLQEELASSAVAVAQCRLVAPVVATKPILHGACNILKQAVIGTPQA
jgi:hypothetical protein